MSVCFFSIFFCFYNPLSPFIPYSLIPHIVLVCLRVSKWGSSMLKAKVIETPLMMLVLLVRYILCCCFNLYHKLCVVSPFHFCNNIIITSFFFFFRTQVLLTAKCVLFNWRDSLQKDRILDLLGVMCRAASTVGKETAPKKRRGSDSTDSVKSDKEKEVKPFGHLHIVFRDWNFDGDEVSDIYLSMSL